MITALKIIGIAVPFWILSFLWRPWALVALLPLGYVWHQQRGGRSLDWTNDDKGLAGEQMVGRFLGRLAPRILAVHDLDIGWGNADNVAITPTGVFAIEVKNWRGRFYKKHGRLMFNESPAEEIRSQVIRSACRVHDMLLAAGFDVFVQGVLVSTNASVMAGGFEVGSASVKVVTLDNLERILSAGRHPLTPLEQQGIRDALWRRRDLEAWPVRAIDQLRQLKVRGVRLRR